jgi:hypothetical protein
MRAVKMAPKSKMADRQEFPILSSAILHEQSKEEKNNFQDKNVHKCALVTLKKFKL